MLFGFKEVRWTLLLTIAALFSWTGLAQQSPSEKRNSRQGSAGTVESSASGKIDPRLRALPSEAVTVPVFIVLKNQPQREIMDRVAESKAGRLQSAQVRHQWLSQTSASNPAELRQASDDLDAVVLETRREAFREIESRIRPEQDVMESRLKGLGASRLGRYSGINMLSAEIPATMLSILESDPDVAEVFPASKHYSQIANSVPAMGATTFWANGFTGQGVSVAVLDSGVKTNHPAFAGKVINSQVFLANGITDECFGDNAATAEDLHGHGTHVAGIIMSQGSAGWTNYQGVAKGIASLYNLKIGYLLNPTSTCTNDVAAKLAIADERDIVAAIDWLVKNTSVKVVNESYGSRTPSEDTAFSRSLDQYADNYGLFIAVSAGNSGPSFYALGSPANAYNVTTVANWDTAGLPNRTHLVVDPTSSRGPTIEKLRYKPDIAAPGQIIYSTAYDWDAPRAPAFVPRSGSTGSSIAAPHIAGAAALIRGAFGSDALQSKAVLLNSAEATGAYIFDYDRGWGFANLTQAFQSGNAVSNALTGAGTPGHYRLYKITSSGLTKATVTWNRHIAANGTPSFNDIDLVLYNLADNTYLYYSTSTVNNVEQVATNVAGDSVLKVSLLTPAPLPAGLAAETYALAVTTKNFSLVEGPKLQVQCSAPATVAPGAQFSVNCTLNNAGDLPAFDATGTFTVPAEFNGATRIVFGKAMPGTPIGPQSVTLTAPATTGNFALDFTVLSKSFEETFTATATILVTVGTVAGPPAAPVLTAPANNATGVATSTSLTWGAVPGATSYDVYLGTAANPPLAGNSPTASYSPANLATGTTYFWKVIAKNAGGPSSPSPIWSFTTAVAQPAAPVLTAPANAATGISLTPALTWNASAGATSYDVYFGTTATPALATNTANTTYSPAQLTPNTTYYWKVLAKNAAGSNTSPTWSFTTQGVVAADKTIFGANETPSQSYNGGSVELGVRFRSDVSGFVKGVRFYKVPGDNTTHTGSLWTNNGQLLATATFSGETASGWQQVNFSQPVAITSGTTYIASYHTGGAFYYEWDRFKNSGVDNAPLHALKDGVDGGNGLYSYGAGGSAPSNTYASSNYFVDPVFTQVASPSITVVSGSGQSATHGTAFSAALKAKATDSNSNPVAGVTVTFAAPASGASAAFNGNATVTAVTDASGIATSPIPSANGVDGTYSVSASAPGYSSATFTLTNTPPPGSAVTIFTASESPSQSYNGGPVELGVRFRSDAAGLITGVRFYKVPGDNTTHTGSLWTNAGQLLATGTFVNETASGWQQLAFPSAVAIAANTTYIASYHTGGAFYYEWDRFKNAGVDNAPLHALKDGVDGGNGLFLYGPGGSAPNSTYASSNYWVDVVFTQNSGPPPTPDALTVVSGTPQSTSHGTSFALPLKAKVTGGGIPVPGVTVTFTAPASGASATFNGNATATAVTDATGVATSPMPLANGTDGTYNVSASASGLTSVSFSLTNTPVVVNNDKNIFVGNEVPTQFYNGGSVELGVRFRSDVTGLVKGIRFYKINGDSSQHTGSLWTNNGQLLATGTFSSETNSGWQQLTFANPVQIAANTTYVASYHTGGAFYYTWYTFQNAGVDNAPLHALKDGVDGGNGLYLYGAGGAMPTNSYLSSNYWVDVVFAASGNQPTPQTVTVVSGTPQSAGKGSTFGAALKAKVTDASANPVAGVTVTFTAPASGASAIFNGSATATAVTDGTGVATSPLPVANSTEGAYSVVASVAGIASTATFALTNTAAVPSDKTIFTVATVPNNYYNGGAVELGVRFKSDVNGQIKGIRFFKAPGDVSVHTGSLWTNGGQLLATGTFSNETASGWQVLTFSQPVAITANTTYIASYHTNGGFYYEWNTFQNAGVDNAPLHALKDGVSGGNGLYRYGAGGTAPDSSYLSSNYWVDVVFTPAP